MSMPLLCIVSYLCSQTASAEVNIGNTAVVRTLRKQFASARGVRIEATQEVYLNAGALWLPEDLSTQASNQLRQVLSDYMKGLPIGGKIVIHMNKSGCLRIEQPGKGLIFWNGTTAAEVTETNEVIRQIQKSTMESTPAGALAKDLHFMLYGDPKSKIVVRKINDGAFSRVTSGIDTRMNVSFLFGDKIRPIYSIESAYFDRAPLSVHFDQPTFGAQVRLHWSALKFVSNPPDLEAKLKIRTGDRNRPPATPTCHVQAG